MTLTTDETMRISVMTVESLVFRLRRLRPRHLVDAPVALRYYSADAPAHVRRDLQRYCGTDLCIVTPDLLASIRRDGRIDVDATPGRYGRFPDQYVFTLRESA